MNADVLVYRKEAVARYWQRWLPPLLLLIIGFYLVPLVHTCRLACVPGDMGDARFNGVILEHFYRWLTGHESSLISPRFFFPMPGAVTFSDNHWGTAWLYSLYRMLGANEYQAFDLWYMGSYVLNFLACHWVLRRFGFSSLASALGAFAFSFAMPVIARHGHAQLGYRFLVPIALLCWQRFRQSGRWLWLGWVALAVTGQFYLSIYIGYFLVLLLGSWACAQVFVEKVWPWKWFLPGIHIGDPGKRRELLWVVAMAALAMVALAALLHPYLHYSKLYGFHRGLDEIKDLLPRLRSYVLADGSLIWGNLGRILVPDISMRHEQQIFFGVGILGLSTLALMKSPSRLCSVAIVSILLLVALTVDVRGHSIYLYLVNLPGTNSIRAIARIGLILAMPFSVLVACGVDAARGRGMAWMAVATVLSLMMVVESAAMRTVHFDAAQARTRIEKLRAQLPGSLPEDAIIYVQTTPERSFLDAQLDGMLLAQLLGRPTFNGYSGNLAPGYWPSPTTDDKPCLQAAQRLDAAASFYKERLHRPLPAAAYGQVIVPGQATCEQNSKGKGP